MHVPPPSDGLVTVYVRVCVPEAHALHGDKVTVQFLSERVCDFHAVYTFSVFLLVADVYSSVKSSTRFPDPFNWRLTDLVRVEIVPAGGACSERVCFVPATVGRVGKYRFPLVSMYIKLAVWDHNRLRLLKI